MMPTLWPFFAGFISAALVVPLLIAWQRKRALGQQIYEDGPKAHAAKQGTPTMGGLSFLVAALIGYAFAPAAPDGRLLALALAAGAIGAADDVLILLKQRALGLKARWKFALLAVVAIAYLLSLPRGAGAMGEQWFGGIVSLPPWLWWFLAVCAVVGSANAVNLTDGIDGLAAGSVLAPLCILSLAALSSVSMAVLGACVAFLWYNRHPARIFMGDAWSLLLGALIAGLAIQAGWLLFLPLIGIVFVVEALSVMLQVASFKLTGKRIFKMSPLHHHFELSGWPEQRVAGVFAAASALATFAVVTIMFVSRSAAVVYPGIPAR